MLLPESEEIIMSILWDKNEPLTLMQVEIEAKKRFNKIWKPQTIATLLTRLSLKDFVSSTKRKASNNRTYTYYEAAFSKDIYTKQRIKDVCHVLFHDDLSEMTLFVSKNMH